MANWTGVITNAGNNVLLEWINEKTLHFDSAAAGQGTVETVGMLAQTALVNQKQVASIIGAERVNMGIRLKIRITAPQTAYTLNQYGVWASITGGSTTMIALFQHEKGIPIPSAAESPDFVYTFYALISTSNTGKWTVNIDTSASVTLEEMNAAIETAVATKEGLIKDASEKDSLADGDCIAVVDSADGDKTKRVLWSTVKAALAKLFVPLTRKINGKVLSSDVTLTGEDIKVSGSDETSISTSLSNKLSLSGGTMSGAISFGNNRLVSGGETPTQIEMVAGKASIRLIPENAVGNDISQCVMIRDTGSGSLYPIATATPPQEYDLPLAEGATSVGAGYKNAYSKDQFGVVRVWFSIRFETLPDVNETVFSLPEGFRPTTMCCGSAYLSMGVYYLASININVNGDCCVGYGGIAHSGAINMHGFIEFPTTI